MQISIRKLFAGFALAATFAAPAFADIKIAVVDYGRLLAESPQAKSVSDALDAEFKPREQQLIAAQNSFKTRNEKFQKDSATMTADQKSKAEKELRDALRELERKKAELQDDANARRQEEVNKLQRTLIVEVRDYAKSQAYDVVLADGVIYHNPSLDITSAVLAALNAKAGKPAAAPAAAPAKPAAKP